RLGDLVLRPRGSIGVRLEQDLGTAKLLRRPLEILDDVLTAGTLFVQEADDGLLVHGAPPCAPNLPRYRENHQPLLLALEMHQWPGGFAGGGPARETGADCVRSA